MTAFSIGSPRAATRGKAAAATYRSMETAPAGNAFLTSLIAGVGAAVTWTTFYKGTHSHRLRDSLPDHQRVYDAIARRHPVAARVAMKELVHLALRDTTDARQWMSRKAGESLRCAIGFTRPPFRLVRHKTRVYNCARTYCLTRPRSWRGWRARGGRRVCIPAEPDSLAGDGSARASRKWRPAPYSRRQSSINVRRKWREPRGRITRLAADGAMAPL